MTNVFGNKKNFQEGFCNKLKNHYNKDVKDASLFEVYSILSLLVESDLRRKYELTQEKINKGNQKKVIYFSMEFLIGRLLNSNLHNLGVYEVVDEGLKEFGIDLNELEDIEADAGLGNGGLGRLAACFLDSTASLALPFFGNSLRYQHGFFKQKFVNNRQHEESDNWLDNPFVWEERRDDLAVDIPFFGYVEHTKLINPVWIKAIPYDVKVAGYQNGVVNHLRLWKTEESSKQHYKDDYYYFVVNNISNTLYPDDSHEKGRTLRLQQQYTMSAAGIKSTIYEHKSLGRDVRDLANYYVFQINDTHATLIIPELMRILMDEEGLGYDESWEIVNKTVAFTNHTILSEALERWNINIFRNLLPRIHEIIVEMDRRYKIDLKESGLFNEQEIYYMGLIGNTTIRMAHICIYASFSINGVAALHTDILKNIEMKNFNKFYPTKFNNKTNGVTHRRWLAYSNPLLAKFFDKYLDNDWIINLEKLEGLLKYQDDKKVLDELAEIKLANKVELAKHIYEKEGIKVNPNSIFDIQVKRLHEYKRQLLNILHIIYVYQRLKYDNSFKENYHPHTFIFGAKAAPSYHIAKGIIELINQTAKVVNSDPDTKDLLQIIFVENYNVSYAEKLMPACNLSIQISTASKEASGTGNMKFMMNGALTLGTMDGANVEIVEHAGVENNIIFGLSSKEVTDYYQNGNYKPRDVYHNDARIQAIFSFIRNLNENPGYYDYILNNLLNNDHYFVLEDFASFVDAHEKANQLYKDKYNWLKMSLINIAKSGFFSSDRTISDYNKDIWHLEEIK